MTSSSLKPFAWLSIGAALATIALKGLAWMMTGSVGLLSDALASLINLVVGSVLLRAGKRHRSITLEADAHHLLTDV